MKITIEREVHPSFMAEREARALYDMLTILGVTDHRVEHHAHGYSVSLFFDSHQVAEIFSASLLTNVAWMRERQQWVSHERP